MEARIFLSHSSAQKALVGEVAKQLGIHNIHFDEWTFESGNKTWEEILHAIGNTGLFVLLASREAFKSEWVINEVYKAKELLDKGQLKGFLALNIDSTLEINSKTHEEFKKFPQWVFDEYNMRQVTSPRIIVSKIRGKLNSMFYELDTDYRRYRDIYFGRDEEKAIAKRRVSLKSQQPLTCICVSGFESIGRRKFLVKVLEESAILRAHQEPPMIVMGEDESIENFIIKLFSEKFTNLSQDDISNINSLNLDRKIDLAVNALISVGEWSRVLIVEDPNSIVDFDGVLAEWFDRILTKLEASSNNKLMIALISKSRINAKYLSTRNSVFQIVLKPLSQKDCKSLFTTLCDFENITIDNPAHIDVIADTFNGEPNQVFYAIKYILNDSLVGLLQNIESLKTFNLKRTSNSLLRFEKDQEGIAKPLLKTLSKLNIFNLDLVEQVIVPIWGRDKTFASISSFVNNHIIELLRIDSFTYQVNRAVRIYVSGNKEWKENVELSSSLENYLRSLAKELLFLLENDFSLYEMVVKEGLTNNWDIDPRFVLPSYQLNLIIQKYREGRYEEVFQIGDSVLSNKGNLDQAFLNKILNWYCKALIRIRRDTEFKEMIKLITDKSIVFILMGFFHRLNQRYKAAIDNLKLAEGVITKGGALVYRELALCYSDIEDYANCYRYAKRYYDLSGLNTFSTNLYFRSLVRHKELDANYNKILPTLLEELKRLDGEFGEHYLIAQSQYYAFIDGDKYRAYSTIDEAIRLYTERFNHQRLNSYPFLDKMSYCALFNDKEELKVTIDIFEEKFKKEHHWLMKPQFLKYKLRYFELINDRANVEKFRALYTEKSRSK